MERGRMLFDASAYTFFEASGDSEGEYFDGGAVVAEYDAAAAEDDAQSCSYGSVSDSAAVNGFDGGGDDFHGAAAEDGGDASEEEDGVVDQCGGGGAVVPPDPAAAKGCEESSVKLMNDREADKLFWEACLAS